MKIGAQSRARRFHRIAPALIFVLLAGFALQTTGCFARPGSTDVGDMPMGPQPQVDAAGGSSAESVERSYELLSEESDRIRDIVQERGGSRSDKKHPQLSWPIAGTPRITSPFGPRKHPVLGKEIQHEGLDLALGMSSPVKAAADGTVIWVADLEVHGTTLVLACGDGVSCVYCHLSRALVHEGTHVKRGQIVAKSGKTGLATGPHLHFEVRINGKPQNPRGYLPKLVSVSGVLSGVSRNA